MRLIDADELKEILWRSEVDTRKKINDIVDRMPTIGFTEGMLTELLERAIYIVRRRHGDALFTEMLTELGYTDDEAAEIMAANAGGKGD